MGGVGIAMSHGAESTLTNPALITKIAHTEISFGGTVFMPDIQAKMGMAPKYTSDADMNLIPKVSIAHKINESFYIGVGMWGYRRYGCRLQKCAYVTNLQFMQFAIPLAACIQNGWFEYCCCTYHSVWFT